MSNNYSSLDWSIVKLKEPLWNTISIEIVTGHLLIITNLQPSGYNNQGKILVTSLLQD